MPIRKTLLLHPTDNVLLVVSEAGVKAGENCVFDTAGPALISRNLVPMGHKIARARIPAGGPVRKLGTIIGVARVGIEPGEHVHNHNVRMPEETDGLIWHRQQNAFIPEGLPTHFLGYRRDSGPAGVRNYIVVVASVNCAASVVKAICRHFLSRDLAVRNIHGVIPVVDPAGCTQEIGGEYHQLLNRTLAGWIYHPNVVGALVVGLGCEGTTFKTIEKHAQGRMRNIPVEHYSIQEVGGTGRAIRAGIAKVNSLIERCPNFEQAEVPVSELAVALNCGGSDAFSSITANPALGIASDIIVRLGGSVVLAEIPECHGAEKMLSQRMSFDGSRDKFQRILQWWEDYGARQKVTMNTNLAQGNISGGISTIIEKSLGAIAKAGSHPIVDVLDYAEPVMKKGLNLMNTPGYDPVSVTGLVAGGCQLVAFTTGRGSVYGCAIAPTLKIATTSSLFHRLRDDMDVNAGEILEGKPLSEVGAGIFRALLSAAEGKKTHSEELGIGWEEFIPWAVGEVL